MIYTHQNCAPITTVFDVEQQTQLKNVVAVDTSTGEVHCTYMPIRVVNDSVLTYSLVFRSIYAIKGVDYHPCLFHCYGRIAGWEQ